MYVAPAAIVTLAATAATAKFPVATAATVTTAATTVTTACPQKAMLAGRVCSLSKNAKCFYLCKY